jgi:hypothetical protein
LRIGAFAGCRGWHLGPHDPNPTSWGVVIPRIGAYAYSAIFIFIPIALLWKLKKEDNFSTEGQNHIKLHTINIYIIGDRKFLEALNRTTCHTARFTKIFLTSYRFATDKCFSQLLPNLSKVTAKLCEETVNFWLSCKLSRAWVEVGASLDVSAWSTRP